MRSIARSEGTGWGGWLAVGAGVLVILAMTGLVIYGGSVHPHRHAVEQVLPNDRFPN